MFNSSFGLRTITRGLSDGSTQLQMSFVHFLRLLVGLLGWYVGRKLVICTLKYPFFQTFSPASMIFTGVGILVAVSDPL